MRPKTDEPQRGQKMPPRKIARFAVDRHRVLREYGGGVEQSPVMFATVEAVAQADAIAASGSHNSDVAAQAAAGETFQVQIPKHQCGFS